MSVNPFERELRKVADPLAEETRRVRKTLLTWCLVAVAITLGHLFPSEVTALGLKVTTANQSVLSALIAAVIGYLLVTFLVYGISDFARWYLNYRSTVWEEDVEHYENYKKELLERTKLSPEDREFMEEHASSLWGQVSTLDRFNCFETL